MINFPILTRLEVQAYGLYPGTTDSPGLNVNFPAGLTLVLGANGLGKTTLVTMIFRMLTGPYDIPGVSSQSDLGNKDLDAKTLPSFSRNLFAQRVVDNARDATATLTFSLGTRAITVERRLGDLKLAQLKIDGQLLPGASEAEFQSKICDSAGVGPFGDWILLLRHLVFYLEDRKGLIWDPSAQRQVLRVLFLSKDVAGAWYDHERGILALDSRMRNLRAVLGREEKAVSRTEVRTKTGAEVREELATLEELQAIDRTRREELQSQLLGYEEARERARLRLLKAELGQEAAHRNVERLKLAYIAQSYPSLADTARYILSQLISEHKCLACGSHAKEAAAEVVARIKRDECVVCGTRVAPIGRRSAKKSRALADAEESHGLQAADVEAARAALSAAEREHDTYAGEIGELGTRLNTRARRIDSLIRQLPKEEIDLHRQRSELGVLRARVEEMKLALAAQRVQFQTLIGDVTRSIATNTLAVRREFDGYSHGFLLEECRLNWAPHKAMVGQDGSPVEYPAFALDMSGTDFPSPVRRSGPEQVSESQREFIDLSFRMALMAVASGDGPGTMVIDAPESSLDAVFVSRAAAVLARFARSEKANRLVVTSNLIDGDLVPDLLALAAPDGDGETRVIDLLNIATPTAAVRELRSEYQQVRDELIAAYRREVAL